MKSLEIPIFLALDVDSADEARKLVRLTKAHVGGFKIGPRLCLRYGPEFIAEVASERPVFVDNKYFDIPSTMEAAVSATFEAGASFATVHAQSGGEALTALARLESELNKKRFFKILAVTVLTSFNQNTLPSVSRAMPIGEQVTELGDLCLKSGVSGLVCSAAEVQSLRGRHPGSYLVVPGIRLPGQATGDQKRVQGPAETIGMGASALVVGRPIVEAKDPRAEAEKFHRAAMGMGS